MSRSSLTLGVSILSLSLAWSPFAQAQQSLPTINVGGARQGNKVVSRGSGGGRTTGRPATVASISGPATGVGTGVAASGDGQGGLDRYAEPKPAPFSRSLPANIPAVIESRTAAQINNTVNWLTPAAAFKYLPSLYIRERFIGDTNAIVSGRTTGLLESANTMVYADNILLSNFLGNGFAYPPRWGMVAPEEISRIDVVYGPFSALYPGNSVGGILSITTRMPDNFEVHARGLGAVQTYSQFGYKDNPLSGNVNILVGDRKGDFRYFVDWNHLDSTSQPLQYAGNAVFPVGGSGTRQGPQFFGGPVGWNVYGYPQAYTAATSITHTVQDLGKVKMSYDVAPLTRATYQAGFWNNMQNSDVSSLIADRNGLPIFNTQSGSVEYWRPGGTGPSQGVSLNPGGVNPGHAGSQHLMQSLQIKRDSGGVFDMDASFSSYNYLRDFSNSSLAYGLLPNNTLSTAPNTNASRVPYLINPTGQNTILTGTYWRTGDARFVYRPEVDLQGKHEVSFGSHTDIYSLNQQQTQTSFWPSNVDIGTRQFNTGKTTLQSLYIQDAWAVNDKLKFIGGARGDWWYAFNGSNAAGGWNSVTNAAAGGRGPLTNITPLASTLAVFPTSSKGGFQPKASVEYKFSPSYETRVSMGRAYRFPTVTELFQSLNTPNSVSINNPNLQPQVSTSWDFTQSWRLVDPMNGLVGLFNPRISLFLEDRWNGIASQGTVNGFGQAQNQVVNINRARFRGIEAVLVMEDVYIKGLGFSGNVTFTDAKILDNASVFTTPQGIWVVPLWSTAYPASFGGPLVNGNQYPGVPRIRMKSVITYAPIKEFEMAFGTRFQTGAFQTLGNIDFNHDACCGSFSSQILFDFKANYKFEKNWTATFGIDNIGSYRYYTGPHPNPQRTFFAGINYDFGGPESKNVAEQVQAGLQSGSQQQTSAFR